MTDKPVAWRCVGGDGVSDVTQREDIADQWVKDGLSVYPLYLGLAIASLQEENERLRLENEVRRKGQPYVYVGRDGKSVLARDLEDRAEATEARLAEAMSFVRQFAATTAREDQADAARAFIEGSKA